MFYHYLFIILQFLSIHSLEIDITKKQLAIFNYYNKENITGTLSFNSYKIRESTILQSEYGKFPIMLDPGKYNIIFEGFGNMDRIQYELIDDQVFLFRSGLTKKCFGKNIIDTQLESIKFNLELDTMVTFMYQLSAENINPTINTITNPIFVSLVIDNVVIYSEYSYTTIFQSNYHNKILLKKGLHNIELIVNTQTDIKTIHNRWCSNPELDNGFKHGRYLAIYYKNIPKLKVIKENNINIKESSEIIIPESYYSFPYIISYIK